MKKHFLFFLLFFISKFNFSQEEIKKQKFIKETFVHFKVGTTFNFVNSNLYKILNENSEDVFTSKKNIFINPSVDIEFENHFSKYFGISFDIGFMQTRQRYSYTNISINTNTYVVNSSYSSYQFPGYDEGLILCNIPHLNINPSFYLNNDTRIYASFGLYKYYYTFNPMSMGNLYFNLNSEGMAIYSNIGITESFDIKTFRGTFSVNYFGLARKYDNGIQIALGIAL